MSREALYGLIVRRARLVASEIGLLPETEGSDDTLGQIATHQNARLRGVELAVAAPVVLNHHVLDKIDIAAVDLQDSERAINRLAHECFHGSVGQDRNENRGDDPAAL